MNFKIRPLALVTGLMIVASPLAAAARQDTDSCNRNLSSHTAFMMEALAANGQYPQMNSAIRTRVLGYLLQHLKTPLEQTLQTVSDEDVAASATAMDRS